MEIAIIEEQPEASKAVMSVLELREPLKVFETQLENVKEYLVDITKKKESTKEEVVDVIKTYNFLILKNSL